MVRGSMGQTGPMAVTFDLDAVGDGTGVVALVLLVGDEEVAADSGFAVVVVKLHGVCGDLLVLGVQAVTPRPRRAVARTIRVKRSPPGYRFGNAVWSEMAPLRPRAIAHPSRKYGVVERTSGGQLQVSR
jgi:hypothetical protein